MSSNRLERHFGRFLDSTIPNILRAISSATPWACLLVVLVLTGCKLGVKVTNIDPHKSKHIEVQDALTDNRASHSTRQLLRIHQLEEVWRKRPAQALVALDAIASTSLDINAAIAELALLHGNRISHQRSGNSDQVRKWYLLGAARAYRYLTDNALPLEQRAFDPRFARTVEYYNFAVARWLSETRDLQGGMIRDHQVTLDGKRIPISVAQSTHQLTPDSFDSFLSVYEVKLKGFRNHYQRFGLGAPLVAVRQPRGQVTDRHLPPEGLAIPVTAMLHFDQDDSAARLAFYDPRHHRQVPLGQRKVPLGADFTTPYGYHLDRANLITLGLKGLLGRAEVERLGLFFHQSYDPEKIPIILIHGLMSSPQAWMELTNDLSGEPDIYDSYQIWHFRYPTGQPYLASAADLRRILERLAADLQASGPQPNLNRAVVIGHSMGGLVTRAMVVDSERHIWREVFPPEAKSPELTRTERKLLEAMFNFEPMPLVSRAVFVATPHQGSKPAGTFLGKIGASLLAPKNKYNQFFETVGKRNREALNPKLLPLWLAGGSDSVQALRPTHPILKTFGQLPIEADVPHHTILADRESGKGPESSDGLVTYHSAHLTSAKSEIIVPAGHSCYDHPLTVAEIKRILRVHLRDLAAENTDIGHP